MMFHIGNITARAVASKRSDSPSPSTSSPYDSHSDRDSGDDNGMLGSVLFGALTGFIATVLFAYASWCAVGVVCGVGLERLVTAIAAVITSILTEPLPVAQFRTTPD
jgi:hypothetical protein